MADFQRILTGFNTRTKHRKEFSTQVKKRTWMKARNSDPDLWRSGFIKTCYCMNPRCGIKLIWGNGAYDFDHKDNNPSNNSKLNCFVVCKICHGKHTKTDKRAVYDQYRNFTGYKTIKKRVGYKKIRKKKIVRKRKRKKSYNQLQFGQLKIELPKFKI